MNWLPKQTVVVPIDFSEQSLAALETAVQMVRDASGVHAIHVLGDLSPAEPGEIWRSIDRETRARHAKKALRERLAEPAYEHVGIEIAFGDPGHEIAEFARRIEAELIVLPSHGRTGAERLLLGSVAERVVRLAPCPVLVLRR